MLFFFLLTVGGIGCSETKDEFRGFMQNATIVGDSVNGYYCYLDGGGLVISYDKRLQGIERGYFAFSYLESDWRATEELGNYIYNARVSPYSVYDVLRPISIDVAQNLHITDPDSCLLPPLFTLGLGYRGYFGFNTGLSIVNLENRAQVPTKLNIVYDPAKQSPDTLKLQLCYYFRVPDQWTNISFNYGSISCDISSLANLEAWSDSVRIVMEVGDERKHLTTIRKIDFTKPVQIDR